MLSFSGGGGGTGRLPVAGVSSAGALPREMGGSVAGLRGVNDFWTGICVREVMSVSAKWVGCSTLSVR